MRVLCPKCGKKLEPKTAPPNASIPWKVACPVCDARFDAWLAKRAPNKKQPTAEAAPIPQAAINASAPPKDKRTPTASGESSRPLSSDAVTPRPHNAAKIGAKDSGASLGRKIGVYDVLEEISRGGMGIVYRAFDPLLRRQVAVKVLLAGVAAGDEDLKRFQREAQASARLHHTNIVTIHAVGTDDGRPYFVMDFIEGLNVKQLLERGEMTPRLAISVTEQIAEALSHAHRYGVVHRDVKPANIILDKNETARIMDFGLARRVDEDLSITQAGTTVGTPSYMPPEQAEGRLDLVDGRSDLYALGACFYEMLSGRPPFDGPTTMAVLRLILDEEPTPLRTLNPRIHRDVETICMKCLEKDPGRRYQDGRDLAADLRAFNAGEAISAAPRSWGRKLATRLKRHRELLVIFIAAVVVGLTGSGWSLYRQHVADNEIKVRERRQFSEALRDAERRRQEAEALLACPPKPTAEEEKGLGDQLDILLNQALEAYQKAILLDSASVEARDGLETTRRIGTRREVRSFLRQAREFLAKQNWPAALAFAEEVLERDPGNAEAERIQRNAIGYGRLRVDAVGPPLRVWAKPFSQAAGEGLGLNLGTTPIGGRELRLGSYILTYQTENGAKHEATATVERDQETALALYSNSQEPNMALIPAGELADFEEDGGAISVPTFHIDRFEYPNRAGFPPQSTAGLSLLEIRALCAKEGKRLCTAAQWRRACAGDGRKWPYGAIFQPEACAVGGFAEDRTNAPPSGEKTRCRTPLGVYDMSGNVAEWTDDASDRPGAAYGGDWTSPVRTPELTLSCAAREPVDLAARERLGFRCCKPLEP